MGLITYSYARQINWSEMAKKEYLIEEYKVTQEVVSHYERLVWFIGSILNASVLGFTAFMIKEKPKTSELLL